MDDLEGLKARWNDVLDDLEATNRVAWLALFDGRLASVSEGVLTLDFADVTKFANPHEFERDRRPAFLDQLAESIHRVTGQRLVVTMDR